MTKHDADAQGRPGRSDNARPATGIRAAPAIPHAGGGIHEHVLKNLIDGVMVIEHGGVITVFNAAAERILGVSRDEATNKTFAEIFIAREGFEEFSGLILDTVGSVGEGGREVVSLHAGDEARTLSVSTSYIRMTGDRDARPAAVIVAFSDITEIKELRETELRMAMEVKEQHAELQSAYRQIEERNETLATMLKKVQTARIMATVLVIGGFLAAGLYVWRPLELIDDGPLPISSADAGTVGESRTMIVKPRPVQESISLRGTLAPWRTVAVTSSVDSRIAVLHVEYGQEVSEGDLLMELDTAETVRQHRQAQVRYIEAQKVFETLKNWEDGAEMADARRSFTRARIALERQETALKRSAFLLKQGLVAKSAHEDAKRQYKSQLLDFEAAREELQSARGRGGRQALDKAALALSSAREELQEFAESLGKAHVRAPLTGVILAPSERGGRPLATGRPVSAGESLLTIGDFSRMAAIARVDEIDVVRIAVGQAVSVTGNAFRGLKLRGAVTHVSSQPDARSRGPAKFQIKVTLEPLDPMEQKRLRVGMSSRLKIVVYRNDTALVVPIEAVRRHGKTHRVQVLDSNTGAASERRVRVGPTTLDSVEITAGLRAGDKIVIPRR